MSKSRVLMDEQEPHTHTSSLFCLFCGDKSNQSTLNLHMVHKGGTLNWWLPAFLTNKMALKSIAYYFTHSKLSTNPTMKSFEIKFSNPKKCNSSQLGRLIQNYQLYKLSCYNHQFQGTNTCSHVNNGKNQDQVSCFISILMDTTKYQLKLKKTVPLKPYNVHLASCDFSTNFQQKASDI